MYIWYKRKIYGRFNDVNDSMIPMMFGWAVVAMSVLLLVIKTVSVTV